MILTGVEDGGWWLVADGWWLVAGKLSLIQAAGNFMPVIGISRHDYSAFMGAERDLVTHISQPTPPLPPHPMLQIETIADLAPLSFAPRFFILSCLVATLSKR